MQASAETTPVEKSVRPRTVGEVMTRQPAWVRPGQPLAAAHGLMRSLGVRHLPVIDQQHIVGVLSQGDLRLLESRRRVDVSRVAVEEAMISRPYVVDPEEPLAVVLGAMLDRRIGAVLVADHGRLLGIFTAVDALAVLRALMAQNE